MRVGLTLAYGTLGVQSLLFLIPERLKAKTRRIFTGKADQYEIGSVRTYYDLDDNLILVTRTAEGFNSARCVLTLAAVCTGKPTKTASSAPVTTESSTVPVKRLPGHRRMESRIFTPYL